MLRRRRPKVRGVGEQVGAVDSAASRAASDRVVIVGGGIGGLIAALAFSRAGSAVTIIERDEIADARDPEEAFTAPRRGVPQALQTHGFLARIILLLRERFPEVLADLESVGGSTISMTDALEDERPGDDDLRVLVVRRSTFEWVLRRHATSSPGVSVLSGHRVVGLAASPGEDGRPVVDGVRLDDGRTVPAGMVVAAPGSRAGVPGWLHAIGAECREEVHESDLIYLTRWYRRSDPDSSWEPRLFGHLPYLKILGIPGDGGSLSVTLAVRASDDELRRALSDESRFEAACRLIPTLDQFFGPDAAPLEPIGDVRPMAGLFNRRRQFTDADGQPSVIGFHAVGDAHTTTNPILGRGSSLAALQAVLLADAALAHPHDPVARAVAYEAACQREVLPWYENARLMEVLEVDAEAAEAAWSGPALDGSKLVGAAFVLGSDDPVLGRALARYVNLIETPEQLLGDAELVERVMEKASIPGAFDVPPVPGPSRAELLEHVYGQIEPATSGDDGVPSVERQVEVDGGEIHVLEAGPADGPAVLMVHGFPELAYSWRHQVPALAAAGYRVLAVDHRGVGRSLQPSETEAYDVHHHVADLITVLDAAGIDRAVVVSHDWGTAFADVLALVHPDRVAGLMAFNVAPVGRLPVDTVTWIDQVLGGAFNYMRYFQEPGLADADLGRDPADVMARILAGPPPGTPEAAGRDQPDGAGLMARLPPSPGLPNWLEQDELDHFATEYARTGFTGALNWYRNLERNWETTAHLDGARLAVPTAFVTGEFDAMSQLFPTELLEAHVTDHRFTVVVEGCGHWVPQERPDQANELILRFLREVIGSGAAVPGDAAPAKAPDAKVPPAR